MNGVSHMLPFVVGGGIMIALAFLLDDYTIDPSKMCIRDRHVAGGVLMYGIMPVCGIICAICVVIKIITLYKACLLYTSRCV